MRPQRTGGRARPTDVKHALALASLLLLAACTGSVDPRPSGPAPAATSSDAAPATGEPDLVVDADGQPVRLGVLVGSRLRDVREALAEWGLRVEVLRRPLCVPGVVLAQDPAPGSEAARGSTVKVVVSTHPPAASCIAPTASAAAHDLRAWARGEGPAPGLADHVRLWVANRPAATLTRDQALRRSSWVLDVAYAERTDVRILAELARPVEGARVPPLWCLGRGRAPAPGLLRRLPWSWTLVTRDAAQRACMDVAAVQVWVDDGRRITDVNVLLGSP
ncbi:hypothetical protein GCM10023339_04320 [Alloalcanivorax gelatiniphagus]